MVNWKEIPIPERMQALPKDARGYPIPFNIFRDDADNAHFTINDHRKAAYCVLEKRCPICGVEHGEAMFFAGGPLSAFHPHGCYLDQPMHDECAHYAIKVCPYLAAPKYAGRIDAGTVKPENNKSNIIFKDPTILPNRPLVFVLVKATGYSVSGNSPSFYLHPTAPYEDVEFWVGGEQIEAAEALERSPELSSLYAALPA